MVGGTAALGVLGGQWVAVLVGRRNFAVLHRRLVPLGRGHDGLDGLLLVRHVGPLTVVGQNPLARATAATASAMMETASSRFSVAAGPRNGCVIAVTQAFVLP